MHDIIVKHVHDFVPSDVESSKLFSLYVAIAQLCDERNRLQACIFGKSVRDKLQSFTVLAAAVGVCAEDFTRVSLKLLADLHLDACATWHEEPSLNKGTDDAQGIVK